MSFFDEVESTVANTRLLQALEDDAPVVLKLNPYEELTEFETDFRKKLTESGGFRTLFKDKTVRYYQIRRFLKEKGEHGWIHLLEDMDQYRTGFLAQRKTRALEIVSKYVDSGSSEPKPRSNDQEINKDNSKDNNKDNNKDNSKDNSVDGSNSSLSTSSSASNSSLKDGKDGKGEKKDDRPESKKDGAKEVKADFASVKQALKAPETKAIIDRILMKLDQGVEGEHLFKHLRDAVADILSKYLAEFIASEHYKRLVQLEKYAARPCTFSDFRVFRVVGRGAFGAVSAVQKIDTHAIFAMKEMSKKQVKVNHSEWMVITEKKVLAKMRSPFVLNLKYSYDNAENLYLIFDLCTGGDLKFHLHQALRDGKQFSVDRSRFYAAEVFLGLEHIHSFNIIYRDLKPNNILLDTSGHLKISDLGLAIKLRPNKVLKHLAGTAGYWAPEIVMKTGTYKVSDYWSWAVFLYEMLNGKRPRCKCQKKTLEWCPFGQTPAMEQNALKEDGILRIEVDYPPNKFSPDARDLLEKLFVIDPTKRLGAGGPHEIREHPFFNGLNWERLLNREIEPPFIPAARTANWNSIGEVGEFSKRKFKKVKLTEEDEKNYQDFFYCSEEGIQQELVEALIKMDNPPERPVIDNKQNSQNSGCCSIL